MGDDVTTSNDTQPGVVSVSIVSCTESNFPDNTQQNGNQVLETSNNPTQQDKVQKLTYLLSLAKKKIHELQDRSKDRERDFEAKLQSLEEDYKRQLQTKDETCETLRQLAKRATLEIEVLEEKLAENSAKECPRIPQRALARIEHAGQRWCLTSCMSTDKSLGEQFEWYPEVKLYDILETSELPFELPELCLGPGESVALREKCESMQDELINVKDSFRRFRVRTDVYKKQKEGEIAKLAEENLRLKQNDIASLGTKNVNERLERLLIQQTQSTNKVAALEKGLAKSKLQTKEAESVALQWRKRCEALAKDGVVTSDASVLQQNRGVAAIASQFEKLQREYQNHRERALKLVEKKESEISQLKSTLAKHGIDSSKKPTSTQEENVPETLVKDKKTREVAPKATTTGSAQIVSGVDVAYLRNIVLKYMAAGDKTDSREHMEAAIATVLRFTKEEISSIHRQRSPVMSWGGLQNLWSSGK